VGVPNHPTEIYYGETDENYVIVKTNQPEFDYPRHNSVFTTYPGDQRVAVGSFSAPAALRLALQRHQHPALPTLSTTARSYRRRSRTHSTIAPFLSLDKDPYIVVADGRLYGGRTPTPSPTATRTAAGRAKGRQLQLHRNSVKVHITLQRSVPLLHRRPDDRYQDWSKIFPTLFSPLDLMPRPCEASPLPETTPVPGLTPTAPTT